MTSARKLLSETAYYGAGSLFLKGLPVLLMPVYVRMLPPADIGLLAVAASLASLFMIVLPWGYQSALTLYYARAADEAARAEVARLLGLVIVACAAVSALVFDLAGSGLMERLVPSFPYEPHFRWVLWMSFFSVLCLVPLTLLQVRRDSRQYALLSCGMALLVQGSIIALLTVWQRDAAVFLAGQCLATIASTVVVFLLCRRLFAGSKEWRFDLLRPATLYALPLWLHGFAGYCSLMADRLILSRHVPLSELAAFSVASQIVSLLAFMGFAFNAAWVPHLFEWVRVSEASAQPTGRLLASPAAFFAAALAGLSVVLCLFSPELIAWFAPGYEASAAAVMPWLVIGALGANLYYLPSSTLFARGRSKGILGCTVASALVSVALNLLWIPLWGIKGAALASACSQGVLFVMAAWFSRSSRISLEISRVFRIGVIALLVMSPALANLRAEAIAPWGRVGLVLLYLLLLPLSGAIRAPEVREIVRLGMTRLRGARDRE